jgi:hypothetical protein
MDPKEKRTPAQSSSLAPALSEPAEQSEGLCNGLLSPLDDVIGLY